MLATELLMQNLYGADFRKTINTHLLDSFQQAQELEREQIENAFWSGDYNSADYFDAKKLHLDAHQNYYIQTYGDR